MLKDVATAASAPTTSIRAPVADQRGISTP